MDMVLLLMMEKASHARRSAAMTIATIDAGRVRAAELAH